MYLNIAKNSRPSSKKYILCQTPFSSPFPNSYGRPTTTLVFTAVGITSVITHGHICAFLLTCALTTKTYSQVIIFLLKLYLNVILTSPRLSPLASISPETKIHPSHTLVKTSRITIMIDEY